MQAIIAGVFFVLHGLVHLLYFGHTRRFFDLRPNMTWPDGSWAFSKLLGDETTRLLASLALVLVAIGFIVGGVGELIHQAWWRPLILGSAVFSTLFFILLWDGKFQALDEKGVVALLINAVILFALLILRWPT